MIYIKKGAEPKSLKEYRSQPNATYEDFRDKKTRRTLRQRASFLYSSERRKHGYANYQSGKPEGRRRRKDDLC